MHTLVQKYGKQMMDELIGMIIIQKDMNNERVRELLIDARIITKSTKSIRASLYSGTRYCGNNTWKHYHDIRVRNGRNSDVFYINIDEDELKQIIKDVA